MPRGFAGAPTAVNLVDMRAILRMDIGFSIYTGCNMVPTRSPFWKLKVCIYTYLHMYRVYSGPYLPDNIDRSSCGAHQGLQLRQFLQIGGPCLGCPDNGSPTLLESVLGFLIFGNSYASLHVWCPVFGSHLKPS